MQITLRPAFVIPAVIGASCVGASAPLVAASIGIIASLTAVVLGVTHRGKNPTLLSQHTLWSPPQLFVSRGAAVDCILALNNMSPLGSPRTPAMVNAALHQIINTLFYRLNCPDRSVIFDANDLPQTAQMVVCDLVRYAEQQHLTPIIQHVTEDSQYQHLFRQSATPQSRQFCATVFVLMYCRNSFYGGAYAINAHRQFSAEMDRTGTRYGRMRTAIYQSGCGEGLHFEGVLTSLLLPDDALQVAGEMPRHEHLRPRAVEAHGTSFSALLGIIADGALRQGMTAGLSGRITNAVEGAFAHGDCYLVVTEDNFDHIPEAQHRAYIVPTDRHREVVLHLLAVMVARGIMSPDESALIRGKVKTYHEYNALPDSAL